MVTTPTEETPTSQVDEEKFAQVLGIIRQERQNYLPTRFQRVFFCLLNVFVYGFSLSFGPYSIFCMITKFMRPYWGANWENWAETIHQFLETPMALLIGIFLLLAPILLLLNLPLVCKIVKQNWRMYRLGLTETLKKEWQFRPRQTRFTKISMILGGMAVIYMLIGNLLMPKKEIPLWAGIWLVGLGCVLIGTYFLWLGKERLAVLAKLASLEDSLESSKLRAQQAEAPGIEVSAEDLERVARIEQGQIARERAEAIDSYRKSADSETQGYALLKSRNFITEIGQLDLELRLKVEEQIEHLSSKPNPRESLRELNGDHWHLRIPDTSFELRYAVDDNQRQIQLIALQPLSDQAGSDPAPGNRNHA